MKSFWSHGKRHAKPQLEERDLGMGTIFTFSPSFLKVFSNRIAI